MKVETNVLREEYKKAYRDYYFKKEKIRKIFYVLLLISIISLFNFGETHFQWDLFFLRILIASIISVFIIFGIPFLIFKSRKNAVLERPNLQTTFETFPNGLKVSSDLEINLIKWDQIKSIDIISENIFINLIRRKFYIIPLKSFNSKDEALEFAILIENELKAYIVPKSGDGGRRYYKYAWLGIIPLYGFFVSLFIVFKGIFTYKNRILILVGLPGLLLNLLLFGFAIYEIEFTNKIQDDLYVITKQDLNRTQKDLESYKNLYGDYPDSLEELWEIDKGILIVDPMLPATTSNASLHYKKFGANYNLFSVGRDGKPFTKDDIYPDIIDMAKNKTGLIKIKK